MLLPDEAGDLALGIFEVTEGAGFRGAGQYNAASEKPIEGVSGEALAARVRQFGHRAAEYVGSMDRGVEALAAVAGEGDLVLTLGAGNVWQADDLLLARLRNG